MITIGMTEWNIRYKGSKKGGGYDMPAMPKPTAPVSIPSKLDESIRQRDMDRRRQKIMAAGRAGTILTEGQPLTRGGNATLLGRSTA